MIDLKDEDINQEETKILQNNPIRKQFIDWSEKNGLKTQKIVFPAAFGPLGVPGVAASEYIPSNTIIAAIPNKLMMSVNKAKQSELKIIFKENKELFDMEENDDAEFSILALFLLYEKLKGQDSFWHPYIQSLGKAYTLMDWSENDIRQAEDPILKDEFDYYKEDVLDIWEQLKKVIKKYPQFYPEGSVTQELFFECYEAVMSRCFGWSLPSTCLIPFADMLNHHVEASTHYLVQTQYEKNPSEKHEQYKIKRKKIDMQIFEEDQLLEDKSIYMYNSDRAKYVLENKHFLPNHLQDFDMTKISYQQLKKQNLEINNQIMRKVPNVVNPWNPDIKYFTSSDTEDNDTSSSDEEEKMESKQLKEATENEDKRIKFILSQKNNAIEKNQYAEDEINLSKLSLQKEDEEPIQKKDESDDDDDDDESEWDWYEEEHDDTYFVISTDSPIEKGQQIFNSYGNRKNSFLLLWYGFAIQNNIYDSFSFRLNMDGKILKKNGNGKEFYTIEDFDSNLIKSLVFRQLPAKFLNDEDETDVNYGTYIHEGQKFKVQDLTKEFRLKKSKIDASLIIYLRASLINFYDGKDKSILCVTVPVSFDYELFVLNFYLQIIKYFQSQYKSTLEEDDILLKNKDIGYRERFSIIVRQSQKQILKSQFEIVSQAINIIKIQKESNFILSQAYATNFDDNESEIQLVEQRHKLKPYFKQLQKAIAKKILNQLQSEEQIQLQNNIANQ